MLGARLALTLPSLALSVALPAGVMPQASVADLAGWSADHQAVALPAFLAACRTIAQAPPERFPRPPGAAEVCAEAALLPAGDDSAFRALLQRRFQLQPAGQGLLTGYYEPVLRGALAPDERHTVPLRPRPPDLVDANPANASPEMRGRRSGRMVEGRLQPYHDRAAIEAGIVDDGAPPLLWVTDAFEKFFLQVQGSGRIMLPDKRLLRVTYAGQNGHPYVAIGRLLVDRGEMTREQVTMQSIRAWLAAAPPERAAELLNANPSYVFFQRVEQLRPKDGPLGTLGVPLLPGRSVAVDRSHVPLGAPVWIVARDPITGQPMARLTVALDTGGAIRGPARADLFWGWGAEAGERAGRSRAQAEIFVLLPRPPEPAATATAE